MITLKHNCCVIFRWLNYHSDPCWKYSHVLKKSAQSKITAVSFLNWILFQTWKFRDRLQKNVAFCSTLLKCVIYIFFKEGKHICNCNNDVGTEGILALSWTSCESTKLQGPDQLLSDPWLLNQFFQMLWSGTIWP